MYINLKYILNYLKHLVITRCFIKFNNVTFTRLLKIALKMKHRVMTRCFRSF